MQDSKKKKVSSAFNEDKEFVWGGEKSDDEIKKYMIDENLSEFGRVKTILKNGDDIQKTALYALLKNYFIWQHQDAKPIFELLISEVKKQASDTQATAGESLKDLLSCQQNVLSGSTLDFILETTLWMVKLKPTAVVNEWIGVLDALLVNSAAVLAKYEKPISEEFFKLSGITSSSSHKATSMRILGIIIKAKKGKVSDEMVEIAKLFSQTAESEIKLRLLNDVLENVFKFLPQEALEKYWNDKLIEFLADGNVSIRCEAIEVASRILDKLSESYKASKIKQLFFDHTSAKQPEVKLTIAKLIGPFVYNLRDALETKVGNVSATLNLLQEYSESDSSEFRVSYLFNLPAMLVVYGQRLWSVTSKAYFQMLLKDEEEDVRVQATQVYLKVCEFIGVNELKSMLKGHLRSIFFSVSAIGEEKSKAMSAFTNILPELFQRLKTLPPAEKPAVFAELFKELCDALETLTVTHANWRMILSLLEVVQKNQTSFESSDIADIFTPILIQAILKGTTPLRAASVNLLNASISQTNNKRIREKIVTLISNNLVNAKSHVQKIAFIALAQNILESYEGQYVKGFKLVNVLAYFPHRLVAVRRALAAALVPLYIAATSPQDKLLFNKLLEVFKCYQDDEDQEVRKLVKKACEEISGEDSNFAEKIKSFVVPVASISEETKSTAQEDESYLPKRLLEKMPQVSQRKSNLLVLGSPGSGPQKNPPAAAMKQQTPSSLSSVASTQFSLCSPQLVSTKSPIGVSSVPVKKLISQTGFAQTPKTAPQTNLSKPMATITTAVKQPISSLPSSILAAKGAPIKPPTSTIGSGITSVKSTSLTAKYK